MTFCWFFHPMSVNGRMKKQICPPLFPCGRAAPHTTSSWPEAYPHIQVLWDLTLDIQVLRTFSWSD